MRHDSAMKLALGNQSSGLGNLYPRGSLGDSLELHFIPKGRTDYAVL